MSLQLAAQHLASRGRGPDTQLVHMAPQEVAGLQALARAAGGTLTVNPHTGLAEAGFLKSLLPTIIGAGLSMIPGVGPLMAAGIVGGGTALATGNLQKGLMAGLGAYGGAGLAGGLAGAGAAGMNTAAQQATLSANPGLMASEIGREMGTAGFIQPQIAASANPATASMFDKMSAGFKGLSTEQGREAALQAMGGGKNALRFGLSAASPAMMQTPASTPYAGSGPNPYEYTYDPITGQYARVSVGTRDAMPLTPPMFMAQGGPVEEMSNRNAALTLMADGGQMLAAGGISHLGDYSDGGRLLKGPGDGVSDSIPATIADKRPARLADGEFVVPARIVSELGNGSTDAGARKLYAMMDRIQRARTKTTGKDRVAVDSRAEKALPA